MATGHSGRAKLDLDRNFAVAMMEHMVVPTFVLDADGRVIIWNRACERLTGVMAADLLGTRNHWQAFYDVPRPCLADLIGMGRTGEIDEFYVSHARLKHESHLDRGCHAENWCVMPRMGSRFYLSIDAGPIYDQEGHLVAVVETLRDMTAQKEAQMELIRLASRDSLTGLANRRAFDDSLEAEWSRVRRLGQAMSLIMIDVDQFKLYNDSFGHQQGDECLKVVAGLLATEARRPGDLVARYGGEEFAVILPNVDLAGALVVAERIRAAVEGLGLAHPRANMGGVVTLSLGVASMIPVDSQSPETLLRKADGELYRAKHLGRNQVAFSHADEENPASTD